MLNFFYFWYVNVFNGEVWFVWWILIFFGDMIYDYRLLFLVVFGIWWIVWNESLIEKIF